MPRTDVTEFGSLPSPMATEAKDYNCNWQSLASYNNGGRIMRHLVAPLFLPTPKASQSGPDYARENRKGSGSDDLVTTVAKFLPTPCASDNRDRGGPKDNSVQRRMNLGKQINLSQYWNGRLNPQFVEQMMGYPLEWTNPDSQPSETP